MHSIEAKLMYWKSLYDQLGRAQLELRNSRAALTVDAAAVARHEAQVRGLQHRSDDALSALNAAIAEYHRKGGSHSA